MLNKIREYLSGNFVILTAVIIFLVIIIFEISFSKVIILMLEFIAFMEVIKMVTDYVKKEKLHLRFVIDMFIVFLIRDVVILITSKNNDYFDIIFILLVIMIFFIFRFLAVRFSPNTMEKNKNKLNGDIRNKAQD